MSLEDFCALTNVTPQLLAKRFHPRRPVERAEQLFRFREVEVSGVLYWQAVRIRDKANSYREFRVGCALFAFMENASFYPDRWKVIIGMNTKV